MLIINQSNNESLFNDVIQICSKPTLVAMITNIWEF